MDGAGKELLSAGSRKRLGFTIARDVREAPALQPTLLVQKEVGQWPNVKSVRAEPTKSCTLRVVI